MMEMNVKPEELAWNDQGLIPAIVQDQKERKNSKLLY